MPLEIARAMGVGSSGGALATRKTELVADLTSAWEKFNKTLERSVVLSKELSANIKGTGTPGSGGGSRVTNIMGGTPPTPPTETNPSGGGPAAPTTRQFMSDYFGPGGDGRKALGAIAVGSLQAMPTVAQSFEADSLRSMYNFYTGAGRDDYTQFRRVTQQMGKQGLQTDPMDAMRAAMSGASRGLLPSLTNYGTITAGAATFSNLVPGAGLQGGMQAMAALNQGRTVNMMRMIGVNIRGADGLMRDPKNIADDLWRTISRQATGTKPISKNDIALSLQPGNALASLLDQMGLSNDPVLRAGIINALLAKASGSDLSQSDLQKRGIITDAQKSLSERQRASGNAISASAKFEMQGFEAANKVLTKTSDLFADIAANSGLINSVLQNILRIKGGVDTFGTGGNGLGGTVMGALSHFGTSYLGFQALKSIAGGGGEAAAAEALAASGAAGGAGAEAAVVKEAGLAAKLGRIPLLGALFGKGKNAFSKAGGLLGRMGGFGKFLKFGGKLLGKAFMPLLAYQGMDQVQKWLNQLGDMAGLPDWLKTGGNYAFDLAKGATAGFFAGGPWGALAGGVAELGKDIYRGRPDQGSNALLGLATGGEAQGKRPYIVGEKGPELFVPETDGYVIPNHELGLNRAGGGGVTAGGGAGYSKEDFAKALLKGLNIPASANAVSNVVYWEQLEGGHWKNTASYNPLNTSYRMAGSVPFKKGAGVQAYTSWDQGLAATIGTLTGQSADARGYTGIINGLKNGVDRAAFLKLLQASSWDAGHYGGGSSSSSSEGSQGTDRFAASGSGFNKYSGLKISGGMGSGLAVGGFDLPAGNTHNYGGVQVSVNLPPGGATDPKAIRAAFEEAFNSQSIYNKAVSS